MLVEIRRHDGEEEDLGAYELEMIPRVGDKVGLQDGSVRRVVEVFWDFLKTQSDPTPRPSVLLLVQSGRD